MIRLLVHHFFPEYFSYQFGDACVLLGRFYSGPPGDLFIEGDGNVFHNTISVLRGNIVKSTTSSVHAQEGRLFHPVYADTSVFLEGTGCSGLLTLFREPAMG
jgi:hypothetical protein